MFDAILFVQLGSPEDATPKSVEKYLVECLGDWHTLGNPPFFWNWLLKRIIAPKRSVKSACKYQEMVQKAGFGEMPLVYYTRRFAEGIASAVESRIAVRYAFEFGTKPSISDALQEFADFGKKKIRVVPLFPQRSLVTTVAVRDIAAACFQKFPQLSMDFVDGFALNPVWLEETFQNVLRHWNGISPIVFSFHGTPVAWAKKGDPYSRDCEAEFDWFRKKIREVSPNAEVLLSYQSRFGHGKWLGPFTTDVVAQIAQKQKEVLLVCPSFTAENLETLHEIDVELRNLFLAAGGQRFTRVSCLNDDANWVKRFAEEMMRENLGSPCEK